MRKRNEEFYNDPWDRDFYETGSTRPPKNRGGFVAFSLVCVIILVSATRSMGLVNLQKLQQLIREENQTMNLFDPVRADTQPVATQPTESESSRESDIAKVLDLEGVTVSSFDRQFYSVPYGYLVTQVVEGGCAQQAGVCSGDVIISVDGQRILSAEDLDALLQQCSDGSVTLEVYRSRTEQQHTLSVFLEEEE